MANRGESFDWIDIATKFPSTLVKDPERELGIGLKDGETPDAYGLGIDRPGSLYAGTIPTGTTRATATAATAPTATTTLITIGNHTWYYWHERLWAIGAGDNSAAYVLYGSRGYEDLHCPMGAGRIECSDGGDSGNILGMIPIVRGDSRFVVAGKAASAYVIRDTNRAHPQKSLVTQEWGIGQSARVTDLAGLAINSLATGVYSLDPGSGQVTELTAKIRNNLGNFGAVEIKSDYLKGRIIGTSKFVIQLPDRDRDIELGLFDYGTSGFRWTSPTLLAGDAAPIAITKLGYIIEHTGTSPGRITVQIRHEGNWGAAQSVIMPYEQGAYSWFEHPVNGALQTRRWTMRITAMSAVRIRKIRGWARTAGIEGLSA
jgi:hypothetical protein